MTGKEELIVEIDRIANEISSEKGLPVMKLSDAPIDVQEWVNRIALFILEDRKRVVEPLVKLPKDWKYVRDDVFSACQQTLNNAGVL